MKAVEKRKRSESEVNEGEESRITRARREDETAAEEVEVEEFFTILRRMHMAASYLGLDKGKVEGSTAGARWKGAFPTEDFFAADDAIASIGDHSSDDSQRKGQEDCRPKEGRKEGEKEGSTAVHTKAGSVRRGLDLNMDPEAEPASPLNLQGSI